MSALVASIEGSSIHCIQFSGAPAATAASRKTLAASAEHFSEEDDYGLILSMGGKGGLTSFYQTVNTPMTLRSATVASDNQFLEESEKMLFQQNRFIDNIAEMEHDQPISFGVTVHGNRTCLFLSIFEK